VWGESSPVTDEIEALFSSLAQRRREPEPVLYKTFLPPLLVELYLSKVIPCLLSTVTLLSLSPVSGEQSCHCMTSQLSLGLSAKDWNRNKTIYLLKKFKNKKN
jgi:hypothetical protein